MKTAIDKSKLMKRAWYLVKRFSYSIGYAMTKVWAEMKQSIIDKANEAKNEAKAVELNGWWATDEYKAKAKELTEIGLENNYFNF